MGDGNEAGGIPREGKAMKRVSRRSVILGAALAATGFGCGGMNPFVVIPAIFNGGDSKSPAEFPLAVHPKKKDAKVVVLVSGKVGLSPDLAGVDRVLNAELIRMLDARVKDNKEEVQILKMSIVDKFKEENPNWRSLHPFDFGKAVADGADYVIDVEIVDMDLYKPGGRGRWLQGHSTISISAYDLTRPLKEPAFKKEIEFEYPQGREVEIEQRGVAAVSQISTFRLGFVQRMASDISVYFAAHSMTPRMD